MHTRFYFDPLYWWETLEVDCDCAVGFDHVGEEINNG